jgi:hypothetical protein
MVMVFNGFLALIRHEEALAVIQRLRSAQALPFESAPGSGGAVES